MPKVDTKDAKGAKAGSVDLDDAMFGIEPNVAVMHQVVTAQLAARRSGTQSTKTRAEVRGGGAKPWKQKGTGRARAGSSRSPIWTGGGVIHAPKPRDYAQRTPKKMIRLALKSALSDRAASGRVLVHRLGPRRPEHQGRHRRPRRQRRGGQGPRRPAARGRGDLEEPAQPRPRPHLRRARAQRLRRARVRLGRLHARHAAGRPSGHPRLPRHATEDAS